MLDREGKVVLSEHYTMYPALNMLENAFLVGCTTVRCKSGATDEHPFPETATCIL